MRAFINDGAEATASDKPSVFWIMPFQDRFKAVYKAFKERFGDKYRLINAEDTKNQQRILNDIVPEIICADFVVADVSPIRTPCKAPPLFNANVMLELGIAMSYRRNIVMITTAQKIDLPFDIRDYRVNSYLDSPEGVKAIVEHIDEVFQTPDVVYSNPVEDCDKTYRLVPFVERERVPKDKSSFEAAQRCLSDFNAASLELFMRIYQNGTVSVSLTHKPGDNETIWTLKNRNNISIPLPAYDKTRFVLRRFGSTRLLRPLDYCLYSLDYETSEIFELTLEGHELFDYLSSLKLDVANRVPATKLHSDKLVWSPEYGLGIVKSVYTDGAQNGAQILFFPNGTVQVVEQELNDSPLYPLAPAN